MQLSETIKLYPTRCQTKFVTSTMETYISIVNGLIFDSTKGVSIAKYTTADVSADLPSALTNQCIRDAKSVVKKHYKDCHKAVLKNRKFSKNKKTERICIAASKLPVIKKPCCYINNQNFKVNGDNIEFPVMINGKSKRIHVATRMSVDQKTIFASHKLGTMRIVLKNGHLVAQIVYEVSEPAFMTSGNTMGVDLGIKCPSVSYCSDGNVKFYGNGRKNKYMRRQFAHLRKKLQKAKKQDAVTRINNKEQRIMTDIDHKLSHAIIKNAIAHHVKTIKLEQLSNIRSTTRTSRKNNHSLHTWSFYRLAKFIEYKAKLVGIEVICIDPKYTSQICPTCGKKNHANDRTYTCECGFHTHRDLVGAMNICSATKIVGNRLSA